MRMKNAECGAGKCITDVLNQKNNGRNWKSGNKRTKQLSNLRNLNKNNRTV
jgi:hypothetical protein